MHICWKDKLRLYVGCDGERDASLFLFCREYSGIEL